MPFAAFFVAACLVLCIFDAARKAALCILLGAVVGMASVLHTANRLERIRVQYAARPLVLTAEVESVSDSYYPGVVDAVLRVEKINGAKTSFRVECETLPECEAGQRVQGRFVLSVPAQQSRVGLYSDGIVLLAEPDEEKPDFKQLGQSSSFRARTHRLQQRLSAALRRRMDGKTGGVLAAMTVGDRTHLSPALRSAYRGAGLSHVLVVSGMHVSILCGEVFRLDARRKKERCYAVLRLRAVWKALLALLLVGVTGFTPSVLRAAAAVWVSALGVWLYAPPDTLTSLAVAGIAMTAGSSYAVCDIGFELSFAAVLGTLAGAELARKGHRFPLLRNSVWETLCVSACASAATFPVLVLRGLSASLYALVSSVAVLWLVEPILQLGLVTALLGCWPALAPLHRVCSLCAATLAGCLNRWALWVSGWPGAQIYFDTACAALICLLLLGLGWLAYHWRVRPRVALPCLVLTAALAIGWGNVLNREIVRVELAGSRNAPAVVITRGESAVVLFRGGSSTQQAVETLLTRRGAREVEMLVDLRMNPRTPCTLEARERMAADEMPRYTTRRAHSSPAELEVLRVQNGCIVRITAAGRQFVALSGSVQLAKPVRVDWLLASPARPDAVRYTDCLTLSSAYRWMEENAETETASCLALRPGGGERLS